MTKKEFAAQMDEKLKAVRKEYGFTQEKMAADLGGKRDSRENL